MSIGRRRDYDLTAMEDTQRLFDDTDPELVFHLAAEVGGIGANRANPGRYWYANLMMGAHVLEQARLHATPKLVIAGTICAYPKFAPGPVPRGGPLERLSGGDERSVRRREEGDPRRRAVVPRAVRDERDLPPAREPLRARGQLRPRDVARDSRADPEDGRGARERGRGDRAVGRRDPRPASSSTSTTARGASPSRPSATTAPTPSTSARARRSRSTTSRSSCAM